MISDTLKQIADAKSKLAALEKKAAAEQSKKLANLHKDAGFDSREDLISALQSLGVSAPKKRGPKPSAKKAAAKKPAAKKPAAKKAAAKKVVARKKTKSGKVRAARTKITDELRKKIVAAVKAGGKGTAIAKEFGISIPSLHNIKKAAGLTKARGK
ncbi:MAG: hypothetical protein AAGB46_07460 [Verrucomicrobiota bacterium]